VGVAVGCDEEGVAILVDADDACGVDDVGGGKAAILVVAGCEALDGPVFVALVAGQISCPYKKY